MRGVLFAISLSLATITLPSVITGKEDNIKPSLEAIIDLKKIDEPEKPLTVVLKGRDIIKPKIYKIIATAYTGSASENGGYANKNVKGEQLNRGGCAAPYSVNLDSLIYIEELKTTLVVNDRGSEKHIKQIDEDTIRIDIFMESKQEALKFGVQTFHGYILKN